LTDGPLHLGEALVGRPLAGGLPAALNSEKCKFIKNNNVTVNRVWSLSVVLAMLLLCVIYW